jgi:hypothetical protein
VLPSFAGTGEKLLPSIVIKPLAGQSVNAVTSSPVQIVSVLPPGDDRVTPVITGGDANTNVNGHITLPPAQVTSAVNDCVPLHVPPPAFATISHDICTGDVPVIVTVALSHNAGIETVQGFPAGHENVPLNVNVPVIAAEQCNSEAGSAAD